MEKHEGPATLRIRGDWSCAWSGPFALGFAGFLPLGSLHIAKRAARSGRSRLSRLRRRATWLVLSSAFPSETPGASEIPSRFPNAEKPRWWGFELIYLLFRRAIRAIFCDSYPKRTRRHIKTFMIIRLLPRKIKSVAPVLCFKKLYQHSFPFYGSRIPDRPSINPSKNRSALRIFHFFIVAPEAFSCLSLARRGGRVNERGRYLAAAAGTYSAAQSVQKAAPGAKLRALSLHYYNMWRCSVTADALPAHRQ